MNKIFSFFTNKLYFSIFYLTVSVLFVTVFNLVPQLGFLPTLAIGWGLLLVAFNLLNIKKNFSKELIPIYGFLIITLILNLFVYFDINNLKIWLINSVLLLVFLSPDFNRDKIDILKDFNIFSRFYILLSFVFSLISVSMILLDVTIQIPIDPTYLPFGYNVYSGLFANGNALGIFCGISLVLSIYFILNCKKNNLKFFYSLNIIIQFLGMELSGGRSAIFFILSLVFCFIFINLKNIWLKVSSVLIPLFIFIVFLIKHADNLRPLLAGRENIWKAASIVILNNPIGVGNTNMVSSVNEVKEQWLYGIESGGLHNIFLEVATVNGVLSSFIIISFFIGLFFCFSNNINSFTSRNRNQFIILISIFLGIVLINCLESTILYKVSFIGIFFWYLCGYLISILSKK